MIAASVVLSELVETKSPVPTQQTATLVVFEQLSIQAGLVSSIILSK